MSDRRTRPSVARRVALVGSLSLTAALALLTAVISVGAFEQRRELAAQIALDQAHSVSVAIEGFDQSSRLLVDRFFSPFRRGFAQNFEHDARAGTLASFGEKLNGNFTLVDKLNADTGGVATVFMKQGDDFLRITTSLKKENGERAMGTLLGRQHPAHASISAGRPFVGRAQLFGKPYMTRYEPVKDAAGDIVGALFIGFELTAFHASIDKIVAGSKVFETGGVYVVDQRNGAAEAVFVFHATAAGKKVL